MQTLRTLRLRVVRTLKLFVLSDFESLGGTDSSYFKTPSLSDFKTLRTFRLLLGVADSSNFEIPSLSDFETLRTFRYRIFGGYRLFILQDSESFGL